MRTSWYAGKLRARPVVCVLGSGAVGMPVALKSGIGPPLGIGKRWHRRRRGNAGQAQSSSLFAHLAAANIYVIAIDQEHFDNAIGIVSLVLAPGDIIVFVTNGRCWQDVCALGHIEAFAGLRCHRDFYAVYYTPNGTRLRSLRGTPASVARALQRLGVLGALRQHTL